MRRPREEQHERINSRVDEMIDRGFVDEVRRLFADGPALGRTASQAVGYREVQMLLEGECDRDTAIANIKTRTRRFAKRQGTWFRSLSECRFIDLSGARDPDELAA
jgi:tRNA dimethylallyltransferase